MILAIILGFALIACGVFALSAQCLFEWAAGLEFQHEGTCGAPFAKGKRRGKPCPDSLSLRFRSLRTALFTEVIERSDRVSRQLALTSG